MSPRIVRSRTAHSRTAPSRTIYARTVRLASMLLVVALLLGNTPVATVGALAPQQPPAQLSVIPPQPPTPPAIPPVTQPDAQPQDAATQSAITLGATILGASVTPADVVAGATVRLALTVRNESAVDWSANDLAGLVRIEQAGSEAARQPLSAVDAAGIAAGETGAVEGLLLVPAEWSGDYALDAVLLLADKPLLAPTPVGTLHVLPAPAETPVEVAFAEVASLDSASLDGEMSGQGAASYATLAAAAASNKVDVLFAIDSTGSMGGAINAAKNSANVIAQSIRSTLPDSHFGVIDFRDFADGPPWPTIIRQNITGDTAAVSAAISLIFASGGGDTPEAYTDVVFTAADSSKIHWRSGATRILVVIGDAPPHDAVYGTIDSDPDRYGRTWAQAGRQAVYAGVRVVMVAVGGGSDVTRSYQDMANWTAGLYARSPSNSALAGQIVTLVGTIAPSLRGEAAPTASGSEYARADLARIQKNLANRDYAFGAVRLPTDAAGFQAALPSSLSYAGATVSMAFSIDRYYGPVNSAGKLINGIGTSVAPTAKLHIYAYDVDNREASVALPVAPGAAPSEIDLIRVNGQTFALPGQPGKSAVLKGEDKRWSEVTYDVPTSLFTFPGFAGTKVGFSTNVISIEMDTRGLGYGATIGAAWIELDGTYPIVLIPGYGGKSQEAGKTPYFEAIASELIGKGFIVNTTWFEGKEQLITNNAESSVAKQAAKLATYAKRLREYYGVNKLNLVAHSTGGLDARAYVSSDMGNVVETLITISSPHRGTMLADILLVPDALVYIGGGLAVGAGWDYLENYIYEEHGFCECPRTRDVSEKETTEKFNKKTFANPWVKYYAIRADISVSGDASKYNTVRDSEIPGDMANFFSKAYWFLYRLSTASNAGKSDGFISYISQALPPESGHTADNTRSLVVVENHETSHASKRLATPIAYILGWDHQGKLLNPGTIPLSGSGAAMHIATPEETQAEEKQAEEEQAEAAETLLLAPLSGTLAVPSTAPSQLALSGVIAENTSIQVPIHVDNATGIEVTLLYGTALVAGTLRTPGGDVVTAATAGATLDVFGSDGFHGQSWTLATAQPGVWYLEIVAGAPLVDGHDKWTVLFDQTSSSVVAAMTLAPSPARTGAPVVMEVAVAESGAGKTGVTVQAAAADMAGNTVALHPRDDGFAPDRAAGDGVYTAEFVPPAHGFWTVVTSAEGVNAAGHTFQRGLQEALIVAQSDAGLTSLFGWRGVDENGDGLSESLAVDLEVQTTRAGVFAVNGNLYDAAGALQLGSTGVITVAAAGLYPITLLFDGQTLAELPAGELTLRDLLVTDADSGELQDASVGRSHVIPLQPELYAAVPIQFAGAQSDLGIDDNGNGKYDLLRVEAPIKVSHGGDYRIGAALETAAGDLIDLVEQELALSAGVTTLTLDFDGVEVARSGNDGPYAVVNFIVTGPLSATLAASSVYTTTAYSVAEFEADTAAPETYVTPLPAAVSSPLIQIAWTSVDAEPSTGIHYYDAQYREGPAGAWTDWYTQTALSALTFGPTVPLVVTSGTTYYFRVRATDFAGNVEAWTEGDGDTFTTVHTVDLSVVLELEETLGAGDVTTWRVHVQNEGYSPAPNVVVTVTLPAKQSFLHLVDTATGTEMTPLVTDNRIVWTAGTLDGVALHTYTLQVLTANDVPDWTELSTQAKVSTTEIESTTENNSTEYIFWLPGPEFYVYFPVWPVIFPATAVGGRSTIVANLCNGGIGTVQVTDIGVDHPDFTVSETAVTIGRHSCEPVEIDFRPSAAGDYTAEFALTSNDPDLPAFSHTLAASAYVRAAVLPNPAALAVEVAPGGNAERTITLSNPGATPISWTLGTVDDFALLPMRLAAHAEEIAALIPNRYDFPGGESGYSLPYDPDGLFYYGNYLWTQPYNHSLWYTQGEVVSEPWYMGENGRYFTWKTPGLFVLAAELDDVYAFHAFDDLRMFYATAADGATFSTERGGTTYRGFVKRIYGGDGPSLNKLYILAGDQPAAWQGFDDSILRDPYHSIYDISGDATLYYLVYSSENGGYVDDARTETIMQAFLDMVEPAPLPAWLATTPITGAVVGGGSAALTVRFNSAALPTGVYTASIELLTNALDAPNAVVPVALTVKQAAAAIPTNTPTKTPTKTPTPTRTPTPTPTRTPTPTPTRPHGPVVVPDSLGSVNLLPGEARTATFALGAGRSVQVSVPAGAVDRAVTLHATRFTVPLSSQSGFRLGGMTFGLVAVVNDALVDTWTFDKPIVLTITYSDVDVAGLDEKALALAWYDAESGLWSETGITLVERDAVANRIVVSITHLTGFGLGDGNNYLYLPSVSSNE